MQGADNALGYRSGERSDMQWKAIGLLRDYASWMRRLSRGSAQMFAARSAVGRSAKIFLFGVGVALPLGSLIWLLLFWHGSGLARRGSAR